MEPKPGKYQHYKGNYYQVLGIAKHSETKEEVVVYRALYGEYGLWVRPRLMFLEQIVWNGIEQPRFRLVEEDPESLSMEVVANTA